MSLFNVTERIVSNSKRTLAEHGATSMTELYIEGIILLIVCLVAITGNASLFIIVYQNRSLRTITNMFILGLSGADLFVSVANMPVTVSALFYGDWPLSDDACTALGYITMLSLVMSVLSLCNISINRYIMICRPFRFKIIYTRRNATLMLLACITMSIMLSLPPLFGWAKYDYIPQQSFCFCDWSAAPSYAFFMIGCCFMTPLTVMAICNVFIFRSARRSNRNTQSFTTEASRDTRGDEIRLAFMLVVVVIVFVCSWLPYCISMVIGIYAPELVPRGFHMWTTLMGYSNSGANPIIYGVMNRGYRNGFKRLFCFCCSKAGVYRTGLSSNSEELYSSQNTKSRNSGTVT